MSLNSSKKKKSQNIFNIIIPWLWKENTFLAFVNVIVCIKDNNIRIGWYFKNFNFQVPTHE